MRTGATVWGVLMGAVAGLSGARPVADGVGPAGADRALLSRLASETGVQTVPPAPSLWQYSTEAARHIVRKLFGWFHLPNVDLSGVGPYLETVARVLAWLVVAGAAVLMARFLLAAAKGSRPREAGEPPGLEGQPLEGERSSDPAFWWMRLRESLDAGDLVAALESLWFWTGSRLAGASLDPSWTSTELLERTGRVDLGPSMARLDAWRFGPDRPARPEIERLAGHFQEALP